MVSVCLRIFLGVNLILGAFFIILGAMRVYEDSLALYGLDPTLAALMVALLGITSAAFGSMLLRDVYRIRQGRCPRCNSELTPLKGIYFCEKCKEPVLR